MIQLDNIEFRYNSMTTPLCFDSSIDVGEKVALIGPSGVGKSTLLNVIAGFLQPSQGRVLLDGCDHTHSAPHERPVSMLFQDNNLFQHLSVEDNMALGLSPRLRLSQDQTERIHTIAEQVGLSAYMKRLPDTLSGGQQQRVSLARCLLRDKPILLLDEPFSALDAGLRSEMLSLLNDICARKSLTVIMVTHQPEEVTDFVTRMIRLT